MNDDKKNSIDAELYSREETYSVEEKQMIMDRLNEERRINQKIAGDLANSSKHYNQSDKNKILNKLNEQRLSKQNREEIKQKRTHNKEVYKFGSKTFL